MPVDVPTSRQAGEKIVSVCTKNGIEMAIRCNAEKTLGKIIAKADSPDLIDGVRIEPLQVYPDDRGFFTELARLGKGLASGMVPDGTRNIQVSFTLTYPGTIKAIHYHSEQTDLWAPINGMLQVFLCDLRRNSKTFGLINTLYVGRFRPWEILISRRRAHQPLVLYGSPLQSRRRTASRIQRSEY
jgi:dTDP-4-dehydrorhamnose 3,5-epimerase